MKQKILSLLVLVLLPALFLASCTKTLVTKKSALAVNNIGTGDTAVSTVNTGLYQYIATDKNGNIYGLTMHQAYTGADTIYKIDAAGNKTFFYASLQTPGTDTVVIQTQLSCLTADSLGNVYTLSYNNATKIQDVIKISPAGSESVFFSNISQTLSDIQKILIDNSGTLYYYNNEGIRKVAPGGTPTTIYSGVSTFALDNAGNIYFFKTASIAANGNVSLELVRMNPAGVVTVLDNNQGSGFLAQNGQLVNIIDDIAVDNHGNVFVGNLSQYVNANSWTAKNIIYEISRTGIVTTLLPGTNGHVDGPLATAKIGRTISMITDGSGNLYFSETASNYFPGTGSYIRKVTF